MNANRMWSTAALLVIIGIIIGRGTSCGCSPDGAVTPMEKVMGNAVPVPTAPPSAPGDAFGDGGRLPRCWCKTGEVREPGPEVRCGFQDDAGTGWMGCKVGLQDGLRLCPP